MGHATDNTTQYTIKAFNSTVGDYAVVDSYFGRARYVEFVSDTVMKAFVEVPFFDTDGIVAGDWNSEHGYEEVWSSTRYYPRSATFHEGRLFFGGQEPAIDIVWFARL